MSLLKNPVILAIIASAVVFVVMYYWYNFCNKEDKESKETKDSRNSKKTKKSKTKKKITKEGINETIVISAAIAGLATWYIASSYFSEGTDKSEPESTSMTVNANEDKSGIITDITGKLGETRTKGNEPKSTGQITGQTIGQATGQTIGQATGQAINVTNQQGGNGLKTTQGVTALTRISRISSDDPTRSYNLIGSGLNIPRSELKIPSVLIDYK